VSILSTTGAGLLQAPPPPSEGTELLTLDPTIPDAAAFEHAGGAPRLRPRPIARLPPWSAQGALNFSVMAGGLASTIWDY
jgi:hypothetical protein